MFGDLHEKLGLKDIKYEKIQDNVEKELIDDDFSWRYFVLASQNGSNIKDIHWESKDDIIELVNNYKVKIIMCIQEDKVTMLISNLRLLRKTNVDLKLLSEENLTNMLDEYKEKIKILNEAIKLLKNLKFYEH